MRETLSKGLRNALGILLIACGLSAPTTAAPDESGVDALRRLSGEFVDQYRPGAARDERSDFSAAGFEAEIETQKAALRALLAIDPEGFDLEQDIDLRLLIGIARADITLAERQRTWENDPALYLPSAQIGSLFDPAFAGTPDTRVAQAMKLLGALPERLRHARENLQRPPRRFTEAGMFQARGSLQTLGEGRPGLGELTAEQVLVYDTAEQALADYLAWLEAELLPRSDGDWALGRETWEAVLRERWHMDDSAADILARGQRAFAETEALAQAVAARIAPGRHWTEVYEMLKDQHPPTDGIKAAYQAQMDAAQVFVREHSILTLPPGERVITLDTPPAMRRSSPFGTFQSANAFDGGLEGRLILTPIEDWMSPEQQAERLRAHHDAWIPVIAVHEAYPGHHAQALVVNQNPNLLRRVIRESIFSEGWGLFTEELMFEQGFLAGDDVRLTQLRNRLWRAARVILDVSLHTQGMPFEDAVAFMVDKVRFDPYAAELEVGMYVRRPTYVLGYLLGMQEIEAIRADWIARHGEPDPPSEFYDHLLGIGAIPPALLREELFEAATPP